MEKIYEIGKNDKYYPQDLLKIASAPEKLYIMGNRDILNNKSVAIVGTRDNTQYGEFYASYFAKELSQAGITVVSGLALGIDSIAHTNSMYENGKTIAVIGSGFKHIYPEENIKLVDEILKNGGAIISEYPPDTLPDLSKFPKRNRIIAGISKCTIVIEAKYRSGSGITGRIALKEGRSVFCVPGRIGDKNSKGTNNLIKEGAKALTDVNDVLVYFEMQKEKVEKKYMKDKRVKKEYQNIYKLIKRSQMNVNEIARELNLDMAELNTKLMMMELDELIEIMPGNVIKIKEDD